MFLTKLIAGGKHVEDNGKEYQKGDVIKTTHDLVKLFPNKFELISEDPSVDVGSPDIPLPKKNKGKGKIAKDGEDVDSSSSPSKKKSEKKTKKIRTPKSPSPHGKRVNKRFSGAREIGVQVFVKDNWYVVTDKSDGELLTDKKLRKNQVQELLDEIQAQQDDEDE